jgi:hypothetical protein
MKKRTFFLLANGAVGIHLLLGVTPARPAAQPEPYYRRMCQYHARVDRNVPNDAAVFIGDSMIQSLCVSAISCPSVNYGIGSDTTAGVLARLPIYRSLERAGTVVLNVGVNDLLSMDVEQIARQYERILFTIPQDLGIVVAGVLPINEGLYEGTLTNERIAALNAALKGLADTDRRCIWLDMTDRLVDESGNLSADLAEGDGLHLSQTGSQLWIDELRKATEMARHVLLPE